MDRQEVGWCYSRDGLTICRVRPDIAGNLVLRFTAAFLSRRGVTHGDSRLHARCSDRVLLRGQI